MEKRYLLDFYWWKIAHKLLIMNSATVQKLLKKNTAKNNNATIFDNYEPLVKIVLVVNKVQSRQLLTGPKCI